MTLMADSNDSNTVTYHLHLAKSFGPETFRVLLKHIVRLVLGLTNLV